MLTLFKKKFLKGFDFLSQPFIDIASPSSGFWLYYSLILRVSTSFNRRGKLHHMYFSYSALPSIVRSQLIVSGNAAAELLISQSFIMLPDVTMSTFPDESHNMVLV